MRLCAFPALSMNIKYRISSANWIAFACVILFDDDSNDDDDDDDCCWWLHKQCVHILVDMTLLFIRKCLWMRISKYFYGEIIAQPDDTELKHFNRLMIEIFRQNCLSHISNLVIHFTNGLQAANWMWQLVAWLHCCGIRTSIPFSRSRQVLF